MQVMLAVRKFQHESNSKNIWLLRRSKRIKIQPLKKTKARNQQKGAGIGDRDLYSEMKYATSFSSHSLSIHVQILLSWLEYIQCISLTLPSSIILCTSLL